MPQASQVITVVVVATVALIGLAIIGPIAGVVTDSAAISGQATAFEPAPTEPTGFDALADANDITVRATTGNALYLDGGGAYVDDPTNESVFTDGAWTVSLVAEPSREGRLTDSDTASLYAAGNETVHVLYEEGNWTARYASGGATAYVEAPADLDGRTALGVTYNTSSGELELYRDGTRVDSAPLTAETVPRDPAYSWIGSVDEVRTWNATLGPDRQAAYADDPVQPLPANASARLMFNDGRVPTVYYADGDATLVGENRLVEGVAGPDLVASEDYLIDTDEGAFEATTDGYLAGAPVVFVGVGGALAGTAGSVIGGIGSAFELIPVLLLTIMAVILLGSVRRLQNEF